MGSGATHVVAATRPQTQPVRAVVTVKRWAHSFRLPVSGGRRLNCDHRISRTNTRLRETVSQESRTQRGKTRHSTAAVTMATRPLIRGTEGEPKSRQMSSLSTAWSTAVGVCRWLSPLFIGKSLDRGGQKARFPSTLQSYS